MHNEPCASYETYRNVVITDRPVTHAGTQDQQQFHTRSYDSISLILEYPKHEKHHLCFESKIPQKGVELGVELQLNQLKWIDFKGIFESLPFRQNSESPIVAKNGRAFALFCFVLLCFALLQQRFRPLRHRYLGDPGSHWASGFAVFRAVGRMLEP